MSCGLLSTAVRSVERQKHSSSNAGMVVDAGEQTKTESNAHVSWDFDPTFCFFFQQEEKGKKSWFNRGMPVAKVPPRPESSKIPLVFVLSSPPSSLAS
jgi:hypothetical protein